MSELLPKFTTPVNLIVSCRLGGIVAFAEAGWEDATCCFVALPAGFIAAGLVVLFGSDAIWIGVTV
jgi:hypothetical protein